jgi:hypothetical protein
MRLLSFALLFVASIVFLVAGCKKDDAPTAAPATPVIPAELVGTWTTQGATLNGVATPVGPALLRTKAIRARLVLFDTGAFTVQQVDSSNTIIFDMAGTAVVAGQKITLQATALDGAPVYNYDYLGSITWSVAGNQLLMTYYVSALTGTVVVTWTK